MKIKEGESSLAKDVIFIVAVVTLINTNITTLKRVDRLEEVKNDYQIQKQKDKKEKELYQVKIEEMENNISTIKETKDKREEEIKEKNTRIKTLENEVQEERSKREKELQNKAKVSRGVVNREQRVKANQGKQFLGNFETTGYCSCIKCNGRWSNQPTATGTRTVAGRTIAVDPNVIPLGSTVHLEGLGNFVAEDTGGAIKGNIIDIYFNSHEEALRWGRRTVKVFK